MTFASKITLTRIFMVPVFAVLAIYYGKSIEEGHPEEWLRWWALGVFITASASDGLDGWIARRFNQRSKFGAIIASMPITVQSNQRIPSTPETTPMVTPASSSTGPCSMWASK